MNIFIWRNNEELGPLSREEIFSRLAHGELSNDDPARINKDEEWRQLSEVLKLTAPAFSVPSNVPEPSFAARKSVEPQALFVLREENEYGPFTVEGIEALLAQGEIGELDFIHAEGEEEWRSVADFLSIIAERSRAEQAARMQAAHVRARAARVEKPRDAAALISLPRWILIGGVVGMVLAFGTACALFMREHENQTIADVSQRAVQNQATLASHAFPAGTGTPVGTPVAPGNTTIASAAIVAVTDTPAVHPVSEDEATPGSNGTLADATMSGRSGAPSPMPPAISGTNTLGNPKLARQRGAPRKKKITVPVLAKARWIGVPADAAGDKVSICVADTAKNPRAILVICVDQHSERIARDQIWQKYAIDNNLALVAATFSSPGQDTVKNGGGFVHADQGSGQLLLDGVSQVFGSSLPIILYGRGFSGAYAMSFAGWHKDRLLSWAAYTDSFPDDVAQLHSIPAIIACDQNSPAAISQGQQIFKQGRLQNKPWTLVRLTGNPVDRGPQLDNFVRYYMTGVLSKSGGNFASGCVWVDNVQKREISTIDLFAHQDHASYLPDADTFQQWLSLAGMRPADGNSIPNNATVATGAPTVIEQDVATNNPVQPTLKLYLRLPPGVTDGSKLSGVLAYCTWENNEAAILGKLSSSADAMQTSPMAKLMQPFLAFAEQHNMAVLTWGTVNAWDNNASTDELQHREQEEFDRNFDLLATAWSRGVAELGRKTGIPQRDFLLYGISRGAQWAHRLALRKPEFFLAVHVHIPSTFDTPTAGANQALWLVTTGEDEYGYTRAQQFYHECRDLGYPIIFKAIIGLGHSDSPIEHNLGFKFFEYALSLKAARDAWMQVADDPFRKQMNQTPPPAAWLALFHAPPFYGDFLNQDCYPANQVAMIPASLRVPLPTKELADLWNR
jgi:hypothetical protein